MIGKIIKGDNKELFVDLEDNSIGAVITDPPYGLGMALWDKDLPDIEVWAECLRVLKPGAFLMVMSSPRQDLLWRMMRDIEFAGFVVNFPSLYWTYAQGAGKGSNLNKVNNRRRVKRGLEENEDYQGYYSPNCFKPSVEVIIFAMKPLSEKTYLDNAEVWGKGYINRDKGRIPTGIEHKPYRQPSHLLVEDDILDDGIVRKSGSMSPEKHKRGKTNKDGYQGNVYGKFNLKDKPLNQTIGDSGSYSRFFDLDAWWDEATDNLPDHIKSIIPFLAVKKPGTKERGYGLDTIKAPNTRPTGVAYQGESTIFSDQTKSGNKHISVKPIKLMSYLIQISTQENDIVLDPFAGSGTTLIAADLNKRNSIGFERDEEYFSIAQKRMTAFSKDIKKNEDN